MLLNLVQSLIYPAIKSTSANTSCRHGTKKAEKKCEMIKAEMIFCSPRSSK